MDFQKYIEQFLQHCLQADHILQHSQLPLMESCFDPYRIALNEVLEPLQKLVFLPGKRWRPSLTLLHAVQTDSPSTCKERLESEACQEFLAPLVTLVELLHNAALIADDIEDNGHLRRGIPALHLSHGTDRALNACNWAYFAANTLLRPLELYLEKQQKHGAVLRLQRMTMGCLQQIHLGQALDIRWHREHNYVPSVAEYSCMASLKTGALAAFAAESGALVGQLLWPEQQSSSSAHEAYGELWLRIGKAFQVLDDLTNITVGNPGKLRGDDWLEGKKSLPLCFFVHHSGTRSEARQYYIASLMKKLKQEPCATNDAEAIGLMAQKLSIVLAEFLACDGARQALEQSSSYLEDELAACRQIAELLYSYSPHSFGQNPCSAALLALLSQLEDQAKECRIFIGAKLP